MPGTLTVSTLTDGTNTTSATNVIMGSAKARMNYNAATPVVNGSYNVSSGVRNGTGDFTMNFSTAVADATFSASLSCNGPVAQYHCSPYFGEPGSDNTTNHSSTSLRFSQYNITNSGYRTNAAIFDVIVIR